MSPWQQIYNAFCVLSFDIFSGVTKRKVSCYLNWTKACITTLTNKPKWKWLYPYSHTENAHSVLFISIKLHVLWKHLWGRTSQWIFILHFCNEQHITLIWLILTLLECKRTSSETRCKRVKWRPVSDGRWPFRQGSNVQLGLVDIKVYNWPPETRC